ncbi:MAG TPA: DUF2142 domain-containing protein [Acidimicrobiales bacterium]|nr:DUF2142 domain-containing protein [Acidimicrobiales bacterium]
MSPPAHRRPRRVSPVIAVAGAVVALIGIGLSVVAWTFATPIMAGPDEPDHAIEAAAIVRGQIDRPTVKLSFGRLARLDVPRWVVSASAQVNCLAFKPKVPASCQHEVSNSTARSSAYSQFSNYPPLYYAMTGLPSLWLTGRSGVFGMRLASDLIAGLLVALGWWVVFRHGSGRISMVGLLVALTPQAFYISSVINDSSMEVAAALATWCCGVALMSSERRPRSLVWAMAVSVTALVLARPASPVYALVILLALAIYGGWRPVKDLLSDRGVWPAAGVVALAALASAGLLIAGGRPNLLGHPPHRPYNFGQAVDLTYRHLWPTFRQAIGVFGWNDTPAPHWTVVAWLAVGAALVAGSLTSRRLLYSLSFLAVVVLVMPFLLELPTLNQVGPTWQGRYWLPILMGGPLLAVGGWRRLTDRAPALFLVVAIAGVGAVLAAAQVDAFLHALHRYRTGLDGGTPSLPPWSPPGGSQLLIGLFVAGQVVLVLLAAARTAFPVQPYGPAEVSLSPSAEGPRRNGDQRAVDDSHQL